jgi:ferredoxin
MKRRFTAIVLLLVSAACLASLLTDSEGPADLTATVRPLEVTAVALISFASLLLLLSTFDARSDAWLRLDWFLPQIRKPKPGQAPPDRLVGRSLRKIVPRRWLSDHTKKRRGGVRRALRSLGISWLASPTRRLIQAVCLIAFLVSFFYVCWPYGARPAAPGLTTSGLRFDAIDQNSGEFQFRAADLPPWAQTSAQTVFLVGDDAPSPRCKCEIVSSGEDRVSVLPVEDVSGDFLDAVLTGNARWSMHQRDPDAWPSHYADNLANKEVVAAELFLTIDPLVSLSTAIASRSWVGSLLCAAVILLVCLLIPRGFCGYLCPLGTTIDLFDWAVGSRISRFQVAGDGWWVHVKYYLLAGTLVAAVCGVLVSGFVSAIPIITRALLFIGQPLQSGTLRGWHLVPAWNLGHLISVTLFVGVLCLGFLKPRFWCKYVCPSGAVFSVGNLFRTTERKVESSCIHCNKCVEICPFDAIKPDFTTRGTDCTMCQTCGGVCPTHAIKFVERWNVVELKISDDPPTGETAMGRRGFMSLAAGTAAATVGGVGAAEITKLTGAGLDRSDVDLPVRPPGSVPEQQFLQMCIRCGECFKVCPNDVLQPEAFEQGIEGMWTPMVVADWAGCESSCNACGQVCPTGAIRPLPLAEKRVARMGLAIVNESTCLPMAGREDCDLCVQECNAAGYRAIEYTQVGTQVDDEGRPVEGSGWLAPVVLPEKCVGCGLCQTRCFGINVKEKGLLGESAIIIEAGEGKEDRMMNGSYLQLRGREMEQRRTRASEPPTAFFVPDDTAPAEPTDPSADEPAGGDDNPFGL